MKTTTLRLLLHFYVFLFSLMFVRLVRCQDGIISVESTEMRIHNDLVTYREAIEKCESNGGELLSINSKDVHRALYAYILSSTINNDLSWPQNVWIKSSEYTKSFEKLDETSTGEDMQQAFTVSGLCCTGTLSSAMATCRNVSHSGASGQSQIQEAGEVLVVNATQMNKVVCRHESWLHEFEQTIFGISPEAISDVVNIAAENIENIYLSCRDLETTRIFRLDDEDQNIFRYQVRTTNRKVTVNDLLLCYDDVQDEEIREYITPPIPASCRTRTIDGFTFPQTLPDRTSFSIQQCPNISGNVSEASVRCVLTEQETKRGTLRVARFDESSFVKLQCDLTIEELIQQTNRKSQEGAAVEDIVRDTTEQLQLLSRSSSLSVGEADRAVDAIDTVVQLVTNSTISISSDIFASLLESSSNVNLVFNQNAEESVDEEDSTRRYSVVEGLINMTQRIDFNNSEISRNFDAQSITMQVLEVPIIEDFSFRSVIFQPFRFNKTTDLMEPSMKATVPSEAFKKVFEEANTSRERRSPKVPRVNIVFGYFEGSGLYPSNQTVKQVVLARLRGDTVSTKPPVVVGLRNPVKLLYLNENRPYGKQPYNEEDLSSTAMSVKYSCVFWDTATNDWSSEGCCFNVTSERAATCQCYHLTSFSVIVSNNQASKNLALSILSYIGCGLTVGFLLITIVLHLLNKKLRKQLSDQIQINFFTCLLVGYATFLFGVENVENDKACTAIALVLHFSFLASFFWTAVYSQKLYTQIGKKSVHITSEYYIYKACAFAYLTPLIIIVITAAVSWAEIDPTIQDEDICPGSLREVHSYYRWTYRSNVNCWIHKEVLYYSFLLHVGLILLFNLAVTAIVCKRVISNKEQIRSNKPKISKMKKLVMICTLSVVLGLTWLVGFLFLIDDDETYQLALNWIFVLLNSFTGISLFLITCVKRKAMLEFWLFPLQRGISRVRFQLRIDEHMMEQLHTTNGNKTSSQTETQSSTLPKSSPSA